MFFLKTRRLLNLGLSKNQLGVCKNEGCLNKRRPGSAYCQKCSDKFKK